MQNILMKFKIALSLMLFIVVSQFTTVEARANSVSNISGSSNLNGLYPSILSEEEEDDDDEDDNNGCENENDDEDENHDGDDEDEDENHDGDDEDEDHDGDDEDDGDDCNSTCDDEDEDHDSNDEDDNDGDDEDENHDGDDEDENHDGDDEDENHDGDDEDDNDSDDEGDDNGHCTGSNPPPPPPAPPVSQDLGDAPATYGQASHILLVNNNPFLGTIAPDADVAPQVSVDATADDSTITGIDDEGASIFVSSARGYFELCGFNISTESVINIKVNTTGVANLNGWIDWNADGVFTANEQIFTDVASLGGSVITNIAVPFNAVAGTSFVRLRYSSDIGVGPSGTATDGEVEDCSFIIMATPPLPPPPPPTKGGKGGI